MIDNPLIVDPQLDALVGLGDLGVGRQDDPDALRALEKLDHDRRPTDPLDGREHVGAISDEGGCGNPDVVPRQDLGRAELVSGVGDPVRGTGGVDVHLLELANDSETEEGDRGADARQHGVVVGQQLASVLHVGLVAGQVDGETECVENPDVVAAFFGRLTQSLRTV